MVSVAGTARRRPSGASSTPAINPPENGRPAIAETGVSVIVSGCRSDPGGSSSVKRLPSAPVAVTTPPERSSSAETACPGSSTGATEMPPRSAAVSPTEASLPRGLVYLLTDFVTVSVTTRVYSTLVRAPKKTQYLPFRGRPSSTLTTSSTLAGSKNQKYPVSSESWTG